MSFQHFCRLDGALHIPDVRTLWSFKPRLAKGGLGGQAIFEAVSQQLQAHGYIPRGGQIVDASIVQAPITQTKSEEREALNEGNAPEGWDAKRLMHTDRDARWTKKHGKSFCGYKLHANADARYKLIRRVKVTAANVDDGQTLKDVLDTSNTRGRLLADRGYDAQANREMLQAAQIQDGIARRAAGTEQAPTLGRTQQGDRPHPRPGRACVRRAGTTRRQLRAGADLGAQRVDDPDQVRGVQRQAAGLADGQRPVRMGAMRAEVRPQSPETGFCKTPSATTGRAEARRRGSKRPIWRQRPSSGKVSLRKRGCKKCPAGLANQLRAA